MLLQVTIFIGKHLDLQFALTRIFTEFVSRLEFLYSQFNEVDLIAKNKIRNKDILRVNFCLK